jgi:hypothetical protein
MTGLLLEASAALETAQDSSTVLFALFLMAMGVWSSVTTTTIAWWFVRNKLLRLLLADIVVDLLLRWHG